MFHEKMIRKVDMVKRDIPYVKIFFLPTISASLPKGRRKITEERIKLLAIHPSSIAVVLKSLFEEQILLEAEQNLEEARNNKLIYD
jgi:hypothetical protein